MSPSVVIVVAGTLMPARLPVRVLSLLQHSSKARVLTEGCSPCHRSRSFAAAQRRHRQRRRRLADARALTSAQLIIAAADQHTTGGRLALPSLSLSLRISSTSPSVVIEPAVPRCRPRPGDTQKSAPFIIAAAAQQHHKYATGGWLALLLLSLLRISSKSL